MRRRHLGAIILMCSGTLSSAFTVPLRPWESCGSVIYQQRLPQSARAMSTLDVSSRRRPAGSFLKRGSALLRAAGAAAETGKEVDATKLAAELAAIKPMKIKEIKAELEERGVDWKDLLEKEEFMHRLASARVQGITKPSPSVEETNEEAASSVGGDQSQTQSANSSSSSSSFSSSSSSSSSTTYSEGKEKGGGKTKAAKVDEATRHSEVLAEVMKLKISEIKKELDLLKIPHSSFFEKREFAEALARARLNPPSTTSRGDNVDPDEDPSQYRFVEVKRMPREGGGEGGRTGGRAGAGAGAGTGAGAGGGDPFSDMFNPRGGGAASGGGGGFADAFFRQAGGAGGARGSPFGGGGFGGMPGMGGVDPSMLASIMSNPRAQAAFQRAQRNPKVMAALQDVLANPGNFSKYANDKEISSILNELQSLFKK